MLSLRTFFIAFCGFTLASKQPKLCVNCKHFIPDTHSNFFRNDEFGKCRLFPLLVTGKQKVSETDYSYCSTARSYEHYCGKKGNFYSDEKTK